MQKIWNVRKYDETYVDKICKTYGISNILAKLLISRNIGFDDIKLFLSGTLNDLKDPYLIKDIDKYVDRVSKSIELGQKIAIYGDYDVDGVTSITVMYQFLSNLGADVGYFLPDRFLEGYGLNKQAIKEIADNGYSLIITVDCGITAIEEIEYATNLGLDVIITDHHECLDKLPDAYAIINPKRKDDTSSFKFYAGVGVVFKCISALAIKYNLEAKSYLKYLDLVAIGTISDIVPLVDENRIISKYGLLDLAKTKNKGLIALLKLIPSKVIDSMAVSFGLAPRINACGRMSTAKIAVELLLANNEKKATEIASVLEKNNNERQLKETEIFCEAIDMIEKNDFDKSNSIVLWSKNWHSGVIGIVASRLVSIYNRPVILLTCDEKIAKGSGRCQANFSLYKTLVHCKDLLVSFGGHDLAAGLSINVDMLEKFRECFEVVVSEKTDINEPKIIDVDDIITKSDLNKNFLKDLENVKPYGQNNSTPIFMYRGLKIKSIRTIKEGKHLKLVLWDNGTLIDGMAFSLGDRRDEVNIGDKVDVLTYVSINTYSFPKKIQLIIQDFKKM